MLPFVLALLVAVPARAQEGVFGEAIDVRVVNLEVVVTENGQRVTGLGPEDFKLTVDGEKVPIEYFTEVHGCTVAGHRDGSSAVSALAPGGEVGTSYLLFIDELFSLPTDRNRVLSRMIEQLPSLAPADRMAVVAFERAGRGKVNVPLEVQIPLDGLTFLPVEGGFMADAELRLAVLDEDGKTSQIPVIPVEMRVEDMPEAG